MSINQQGNNDTENENRFGAYVKSLRSNKEMTLSDVAELLEVSVNFVSVIERGQKKPSDAIVRRYAQIFHEDEDELFEMLNKLPLNIKECLQKHAGLRKLISEISKNIEDEYEEELVDEVYQVYLSFLRRNFPKGKD